MRRRMRTTTGHDPRWVEWFLWARNDDFTDCFLDDECFPSVEAAREAWQLCRRAVWSETHRFHLPRAAEVFDGMSFVSLRVVLDSWNHGAFPIDDALAALDADRTALASFVATSDADAIRDYLELLECDLDAVEDTARTLAASTAPHPRMRGRPDLSSSKKYGSVAPSEPTVEKRR